MAYKVTTKTTYGQRLSNSLKGIITGFAMFIIGTIVLFWNEGNFVKTKRAINEAEKVLVRVNDISNIDPALNGTLIHASAFADTEDILTDEMFGVSEKAISLNRKVEYYQYVEESRTETRDLVGGGQESVTTYTYRKEWVKEPINSGNFADPDYQSVNSVLKRVDAKTEYAKNVSFGAYKLPPFMISQISGSVPTPANITPSPTEHLSGNLVYYGNNPSSPQIGDVRVTLTKVMPAGISIIGKVVGSTFEQYVAANGKTFARLAMGTVSADNMFADAHSENNMLTWLLRIVGIFLVIGGLKSMFKILPTLFKVLPFLGNIVQAGVGLVCSVGGGAWSLIVISIAWLFYRPLIGIPILAIAIAGIWYLNKKSSKIKV